MPRELIQRDENVPISNVVDSKEIFSIGSGREYKKIYYISDIHILHHLSNKKDLFQQVENIALNLFCPEYIKDITENISNCITLFAGDISSNFEVSRFFYHVFVKKYIECLNSYFNNFHADEEEYIFEIPEKLQIFAILGNHELIDFDTVDSAVNAFSDLFKNEHINFLHNNGYSFSEYNIIGGIGFAKFNERYNCSNLVTTTPSMSREQEIYESEAMAKIYKVGVKRSIEEFKPLIVVSHYPFYDWCSKNQTNNICTYFSGHNHNNNSSIHNNCINQYSDNQIGYKNKTISFKNCILGMVYNPFNDYTDGYFEITTNDYLQFNRYSGENISGIKLIEQLISSSNSHLFMIKKEGYFGFFILDKKGAKICIGGKVKNISKINDINYFYSCFSAMISNYVLALLPYRKIQEQISSELKELGFRGTIHGCIIDIDFFNHIMLNPYDGKITYYNSPTFGTIKQYKSFERLLIAQKNELKYLNSDIIKSYTIAKSKFSILSSLSNDFYEYFDVMEKIDIKNSLYAVSNKINQLQRLFTNNILREWNDQLAKQMDVIDNEYLISSKAISNLKPNDVIE